MGEDEDGFCLGIGFIIIGPLVQMKYLLYNPFASIPVEPVRASVHHYNQTSRRMGGVFWTRKVKHVETLSQV